MKKLLLIALFFALASCEKEELPSTKDDQGCLYGELKANQNKIEFIKCTTYKTYLAGGNVEAGGIPNRSDFLKLYFVKQSGCNCSVNYQP